MLDYKDLVVYIKFLSVVLILPLCGVILPIILRYDGHFPYHKALYCVMWG